MDGEEAPECTDNLQDGYPFPFEGQEWKSVEAAMQAMKYEDKEKCERIRAAPNAIAAFQESRKPDGIPLRPDWDAVRHEIMYRATRVKYHHHPALAKELLATGDKEITHGDKNPFWARWNAMIQLRCREELKPADERRTEFYT